MYCTLLISEYVEEHAHFAIADVPYGDDNNLTLVVYYTQTFMTIHRETRPSSHPPI